MLGWLARKASEKQEANIRETLTKLIQVSNEAHGTIRRLGDSFPQQKEAVRALQGQLAFDFIGPLSLEDVKQRILEPALRGQEITDGARMAVDHVYDTALRNQQGTR